MVKVWYRFEDSEKLYPIDRRLWEFNCNEETVRMLRYIFVDDMGYAVHDD